MYVSVDKKIHAIKISKFVSSLTDAQHNPSFFVQNKLELFNNDASLGEEAKAWPVLQIFLSIIKWNKKE